MNVRLLSCLILVRIAAAGCLPITSDRILGHDLAMADARFTALPATLQIAYAPLPGARRVFAVAELQRIARTNGIDLIEGAEVCFEIPLLKLDDAAIIESMQRSLPPDASVSLVDAGRTEVPPGRIEFPQSGLEPPAAGNDNVQLWRGFVQYTDTRRIAVWAHVVLHVPYTTVITRQDLAMGVPIEVSALQIETKSGPPRREAMATRLEDVAGRMVRRPIKVGSEIPVSVLEDTPVVRRGDSVRVEVRSGTALLRFDAVAQATAREGEVTELRNPVTGKTFRARVSAGSKAGSKVVIVVGKDPAL